MTPADLHWLEKLAKAATPGPWTTVEGANSHVFDQRITSTKDEYQCVAFSDDADAAFIAAANPATVLSLIALARRAVPGGGEETYCDEPMGSGEYLYRTTLTGERHIVHAASGFVLFTLPYDYRYTDNATQRHHAELFLTAIRSQEQ